MRALEKRFLLYEIKNAIFRTTLCRGESWTMASRDGVRGLLEAAALLHAKMTRLPPSGGKEHL